MWQRAIQADVLLDHTTRFEDSRKPVKACMAVEQCTVDKDWKGESHGFLKLVFRLMPNSIALA
jgi:hypothetical protein